MARTTEIGTWAVYVLKDELDNVRYVGITKSPKDRLARHLREWKGGSTHRAKWVGSMISRGLSPSMTVIEWTHDWDEAEKRWIAKFRQEGCKLVNGNDGGKTMHQTRARSECYPNLKRTYRKMEGNIRSLKRMGRDTDGLSRKFDRFKELIALARKDGRLKVIDERLAQIV